MATITDSLLTSPNSATLFTGAIVLSQAPGGCESSTACTIVTFRDGRQVAAYSRSAFDTAPRSIALPVDMPVGPIYYNQAIGDPAIILCNPASLCGRMTYVGTIGAAQDWSTLITRQLAPVADRAGALSLQLAECKAALATAKAEIAQWRTRFEGLTKEVTQAKAAAAEARPVEEWMRKMDFAIDCPAPPPPPKEPTPAVGCCGEVDSVAGLLDAIEGGGGC
jgi:hypothetical protein